MMGISETNHQDGVGDRPDDSVFSLSSEIIAKFRWDEDTFSSYIRKENDAMKRSYGLEDAQSCMAAL